jgi:hypothetical protein
MANRRADDVLSVLGAAGYTLTTATLVTLKLTGAVSWSWWWVLAPLWLMFAVGIVMMFGYALMLLAGVGALQHWRHLWRHRRRHRP